MVVIISRDKENIEREKLFSVLEAITLDKFPNAVIERIPQFEITSKRPERGMRLSIYTKGNNIYPERVKNAIDVDLCDGIPQLSIESIEAYGDALRLAEAYEKETTLQVYLFMP